MKRWLAYVMRVVLAAGTLAVLAAAPAMAAPPTTPPRDSQPPIIIPPPNQVLANAYGYQGAWVAYPAPQVSDNLPGVTYSCAPPTGSFFPIGSTVVTCIAVDAAGNRAAATFTVTVQDIQPPTIAPHADITVANQAGQDGAVVNYAQPAMSDNVGIESASCSPAPGSFFDLGTTAVTCTAVDTSRNSASSSFTVTVIDTQAPTISSHPGVQAVAAPGATSATVSYALPSAHDNAPGVRVTCTPPSGGSFIVGATTVSCTATDASGNTAHTSFTVDVSGSTASSTAATVPPLTQPGGAPVTASTLVGATTTGPSTTLTSASSTTTTSVKAAASTGHSPTSLAASGPVAGHAASTTPIVNAPPKLPSVHGGPSVKIAAIGCGAVLLAAGVLSLIARSRLERA